MPPGGEGRGRSKTKRWVARRGGGVPASLAKIYIFKIGNVGRVWKLFVWQVHCFANGVARLWQACGKLVVSLSGKVVASLYENLV